MTRCRLHIDKRRARRACAWTICLFVAGGAARPAWAADPNALWQIVHGLCVTDEQMTGLPAPCTSVDLAGGYAVLKDIRGPTQFLLIPTVPVSGIESPLLLAPTAPNYWAAAWSARRFMEERVGHAISRENIGLAVNSHYSRSQEQLHIHVDCVRADVRKALESNKSRIGRRWTNLKVSLAGHYYRAMRIERKDLGPLNPFKLLAARDPRARADMGRETLAVVCVWFSRRRPGFILLSDRADFAKADRASSEGLLDRDCQVLKPR